MTRQLLVYPLDLIKTRVQRDALAGLPRTSAIETFRYLTRDGVGRLYRGLGVSAVRSVIQHGVMWTILEQLRRCAASRVCEYVVFRHSCSGRGDTDT